MKTSIFSNDWQWKSAMGKYVRFPFSGHESLQKNYSQAFQDIFFLMMHKGKRNGSYLEVGGHSPITNSNTYLASSQYDWHGLTIELDPIHYPFWQKYRPKSNLLIADALKIDYPLALEFYFNKELSRIDYLQLDIDPSINTLEVLKHLPLSSWRFSVITFETDAYQGDMRARDESRSILLSHGYYPFALDVSVLYTPISSSPIPFEDWWIDPLAIDLNIIEEIKTANLIGTLPQNIIFSK